MGFIILSSFIFVSAFKVTIARADDVDCKTAACLIQLLNEENDDAIRISAATALGKLGDASAKAPLVGLLADKNIEVRLAGAKALSNLGMREEMAPLIDAISQQLSDNKSDQIVPPFVPPSNESCGTTGSLEERIRNCNLSRPTSKGFTWELVTRTAQKKEVWRDNSSGLLWSDRLDDYMDHDAALEVCGKEISLEARGGITNVNWFLPSIDDYKSAEEHGIREVLPNIRFWFWSSSVYGGFAWGFSGVSGDVGGDTRNGVKSVRCVGR